MKALGGGPGAPRGGGATHGKASECHTACQDAHAMVSECQGEASGEWRGASGEGQGE